VTVLLSAGDFAFQQPASYNVGSLPVALLVGDFNGDGKPDLLTSNAVDPARGASSASVSLLPGSGTGTFGAAVTTSAGTAARPAAAGDFNGDGKLDLALASRADNTAAVFLGTGSGGFQAPVRYPTGPAPAAVVAEDVNGDGQLDLVTANATG